MTVMLSEIKIKLQGTKSGVDEAKNQSMIWNIRKKKQNPFKQNSKKKKESKEMRVS